MSSSSNLERMPPNRISVNNNKSNNKNSSSAENNKIYPRPQPLSLSQAHPQAPQPVVNPSPSPYYFSENLSKMSTKTKDAPNATQSNNSYNHLQISRQNAPMNTTHPHIHPAHVHPHPHPHPQPYPSHYSYPPLHGPPPAYHYPVYSSPYTYSYGYNPHHGRSAPTSAGPPGAIPYYIHPVSRPTNSTVGTVTGTGAPTSSSASGPQVSRKDSQAPSRTDAARRPGTQNAQDGASFLMTLKYKDTQNAEKDETKETSPTVVSASSSGLASPPLIPMASPDRRIQHHGASYYPSSSPYVVTASMGTTYHQPHPQNQHQPPPPPPHTIANNTNTNLISGPVPLGLETDDTILSPLQTYIRRNCIQVFCAQVNDVAPQAARLRSRITVGRVGIRCAFCFTAANNYNPNYNYQKSTQKVSGSKGGKGKGKGGGGNNPIGKKTPQQAESFPNHVSGIYSASVMMQSRHFKTCSNIPAYVRRQIEELRRLGRVNKGEGNKRQDYWTESARRLGLIDTKDGIRFCEKSYHTQRVKHLKEVKEKQKVVEAKKAEREARHKQEMAEAKKNEENDAAATAKASSTLSSEASKKSSAPKQNENLSLKELHQLQVGRVLALTKDDCELLESEDASLVPPHLYLAVSQMNSCELEADDRIGCYKERPLGFRGMCCKHCGGSPGYGKFFPASVRSLAQTTTSQTITKHISTKCSKVPEPIRVTLNQLLQESPGRDGNYGRGLLGERDGKPKYGSRKVFFARLWARLHGGEIPPISNIDSLPPMEKLHQDQKEQQQMKQQNCGDNDGENKPSTLPCSSEPSQVTPPSTSTATIKSSTEATTNTKTSSNSTSTVKVELSSLGDISSLGVNTETTKSMTSFSSMGESDEDNEDYEAANNKENKGTKTAAVSPSSKRKRNSDSVEQSIEDLDKKQDQPNETEKKRKMCPVKEQTNSNSNT